MVDQFIICYLCMFVCMERFDYNIDVLCNII